MPEKFDERKKFVFNFRSTSRTLCQDINSSFAKALPVSKLIFPRVEQSDRNNTGWVHPVSEMSGMIGIHEQWYSKCRISWVPPHSHVGQPSP